MGPLMPETLLSIAHTDSLTFVPHDELVLLAAEGSYTRIHRLDGTKYLMCANLGAVHGRLPGSLFYRIHNAYVVNLRKVVTVFKNGGHRVRLISGEEVEVSRRKWKDFMTAMTRS